MTLMSDTLRWLSVRLLLIGCALLFGIGAFGVGYRNTVNPATFGVILTYSITNIGNLSQVGAPRGSPGCTS